MEEIDIIELLQRVKEGKAPKEIEIDGDKYFFDEDFENWCDLDFMYKREKNVEYFSLNEISFETKIKILDKPIIEELPENENIDIYDLSRKVNEIIRYLRSKDER